MLPRAETRHDGGAGSDLHRAAIVLRLVVSPCWHNAELGVRMGLVHDIDVTGNPTNDEGAACVRGAHGVVDDVAIACDGDAGLIKNGCPLEGEPVRPNERERPPIRINPPNRWALASVDREDERRVSGRWAHVHACRRWEGHGACASAGAPSGRHQHANDQCSRPARRERAPGGLCPTAQVQRLASSSGSVRGSACHHSSR